jgi:hypothetical protein
VTGEPDRGENPYVAESRDDDAFTAHVVARGLSRSANS